LRNPDATVVAQAFAHERELRLMLAADGNAGRVNLREARIGKKRPALVRTPRGGCVRVESVGREEVNASVPARRENDRVGCVPLKLAREQVARDDSAGLAVDENEIQHFAAAEKLHLLLIHLAHQRAVSSEQKLLARLPARVERARYSRAAERTVGKLA